MSADIKMSPTQQQQQSQKVHLTPRKDSDGGFSTNGRNYYDLTSPSKDPLGFDENKAAHPHLQMDKCDEFEFEVPEEAPVFIPTAEEFKNPLLYIQKIRPLAEKFGICKIKPPADWQPPFTLDVEKLRFTPRIQRVNELEAKTRIKLNFLDQIAKFWELQGSSLKIPMVERKQLDLHSLHRLVQEEGGLELVTKERKWSKIAVRLGYPNGKNVGTILKGHYERILYPFDIYMSGKVVDGANLEVGEESDDCDYKPHCIVSRQSVKPPTETTARRSKRFQNMEASTDIGEMNLSKDKQAELRRQMTSPSKSTRASANSPYKQRPEYFNMPVHMVPTDLVEKEFWRLTQSIDEDVSVEYGADLHSMEHGSGFPMKNSVHILGDDQQYADSPWNLNNLPVVEESVLGYINADISGMKIPWMYVGMCFATFCWHNEDHWSYSINYLHWGEPKTWYGVPGSSAERLENCMKRAAPELFQSQPDLLHQLVTILNPNILMNDGVPVYRTDQHAGEFVITFPRAYHAGFNQGYNFAEAVNFCPADWVKLGRECVNHYSILRRFCVFSHDEIVCKMALEADRLNLGIATACYLDMVEMIDTEKKLRKTLLEWGVTKAQREAFELLQDDERQCECCKTTCFLSAVSCSCTSAFVCLRHYNELCKCPPEQHTLKYRYTLDELPLMLKKLKIKAESFETWLTKVRNILDPAISTKVSFEELQDLASEAKAKKFPKSPLLERLNSAVIEADKCITVIQQLDINKIRTRNSNDIASRYKITLEELDLFVGELDNLCCTIDDFVTVKELQQMGYDFVITVKRLLNQETITTNDPKELQKTIQDGSTLCIELPQLDQLKARLEQVNWYRMIKSYREKTERHQLNVLKKHLSEGLKVPPHNIIERELNDIKEMIIEMEAWEDRAHKIFDSSSPIKLRDIEDLLRYGKTIKGFLPSFSVLKEAMDRAKEILEQIEALQSNENYPYVDSLEYIINNAKSLPFQLEPIQTMEKHVNEANAWKDKACQTFLKKNSKYSLLEALTPKYESDLTFAVVPKAMSPPNYRGGSDDCESASPSSTASSSSTISANSSNGSSDTSYLDDLGPAVVVATFKKAEKNEICRIMEIRRINSEKNPERDQYCLCKGRFMGYMYHCQLCLDWFHGSCVPPMSKNYEPKQEPLDLKSKYLCPICMRTKRPKLDNILSLLVALQQIPLRVPEGEIVQCVAERAMHWQDRVRQALKQKDVEMALLEFSMHQKKDGTIKDPSQERKLKRSKNKIKDPESSAQLTPSSSDAGSDTGNASDNDELKLLNPEHPYMNNDKSFGSFPSPAIQLSKVTQHLLEELMMEGDLLEVTLDETVYLWRLLNASKNYSNELDVIRKKFNIPLEMPTRIYSEESIKKRKILSADEKPPRKYTKSIKKEIKIEPMELSDGDIDDDDVMDIEEADGTLPKKGKLIVKQKRVMKTKKIKKLPKNDGGIKVKPKRKKKPQQQQQQNQQPSLLPISTATIETSTPLKASNPADLSKPLKKITKTKEKKVKQKSQKPSKKGEKDGTKPNGSDSESSPEESDAYETCGVTNCQRPSESVQDWILCDGGCEVWYHMDTRMENHGYVNDSFDTLKTLHIKEKSLLGDLRLAYHNKNLKLFLKLFHRTGYKNNYEVDDENISNKFANAIGWRKFKTSRNLLFERDDDENLFEEILRTPGVGNSKYINLIWTECELWRKRDILITANSKGKQAIDYIIESNDDENLFAFLVFDFNDESETVAKSSKNYFLKLKNEQYTKKTGESLFQKFYSIIDEECEDICLDIMEKLLKEMKQIIDIKGETDIDAVLGMKNEIYKYKILKLLMTYWKIYSKEYNHYKTILSDMSPYYKLILAIKERHEYEFEELFPKYLEKMKEKHGDCYEIKVRKDCNSLLEFALANSQKRAMNIIINCPLIDPNKVSIKCDDSAFDSQNAHYIMSKLLEKGYYLGNEDENRVPSDWISAQVFEDFLDSRVTEDGIHGCQIDYNFLIDPEVREIQMKSDHDDNGKLLFIRGMKSLESILNNERLKTHITHPVLSTFINLKSRKFRTIFNMNFYIFIFFFMVPFFLLVTLIPFNKFYSDLFKTYGELTMVKKKKIYKIFGLTLAQFLSLPYRACLLATIYLTCREGFQMFAISDSFKDYFKKKSNQFEIVIIALSWTLLYAYTNLSLAQIKTYMSIPSAFIIIFATVELLSILPYPSMSIYMFMLKQVTNTFIKFLTIFVLVIIAFTFSFCVVLKPPTSSGPSPWKQLRKDWNNYTMTSNETVPFAEFKEPAIMFVNTLEEALEDNSTIFRNFDNPFTSFLKTLQMLSGEYSIDPYTLDSVSKQLLFLVFVLTSFILFNLINGLAISDIALLKVHAEFLNLKQQIRSAAESEGVVSDIYWKASGKLKNNKDDDFEAKNNQKQNLRGWRRLTTYLISLLVRKYPYLHKMDNLCIDFKQKTVKYEQDQKRFHILRTRSGVAGSYILDEETLKKLSEIVAKRHLQEQSVNEKVESLETEVKKLKLSIRSQHEELKMMIQGIISQKS
ncbi:CLUMA_CG010794, isoform A [Clunio marinus]|uniref:[histone H3]-trimethyl-L-lysine(4) demethylase n=1 Tax=Clunio marinus TaxID=568069 RepID=A0A1J1ICX2_9DIPT|nr:CLUMA_CG010794, isoform A [Clunio marinus]